MSNIIIEDAVNRLDFMVCHNTDNGYWNIENPWLIGNSILTYLEHILKDELKADTYERVEECLENIESLLIDLDNDSEWLEDEDAYTFSEFMDRLRDIWDVVNPKKAETK